MLARVNLESLLVIERRASHLCLYTTIVCYWCLCSQGGVLFIIQGVLMIIIIIVIIPNWCSDFFSFDFQMWLFISCVFLGIFFYFRLSSCCEDFQFLFVFLFCCWNIIIIRRMGCFFFPPTLLTVFDVHYKTALLPVLFIGTEAVSFCK